MTSELSLVYTARENISSVCVTFSFVGVVVYTKFTAFRELKEMHSETHNIFVGSKH